MLFRVTSRKNGNAARRYYAEERAGSFHDLGFWGTLDTAFGRDIAWSDAHYLFDGRHPDTGDPLMPHRKNRRSGWDLTFIAPKSVSVLWGLTDDDTREKIEMAHVVSVRQALRIFVQNAVAIRLKTIRTFRYDTLSGGFLFNHGMTRLRDPHLHTHAFLLNVGYADDLGFRALTLDIRWSYVALDLYLVGLAWELLSRGFDVRKVSRTFSVPVTESLTPTFSSSAEVFKTAAHQDPLFWKQVRQKKDLSKSFRRLRAYWETRALVAGFDLASIPLAQRPPKDPTVLSAAAVEAAATTARHRAHVWHHAAMAGLGRTTVEQVALVADKVYSQIFDKEGNSKYLRPEEYIGPYRVDKTRSTVESFP